MITRLSGTPARKDGGWERSPYIELEGAMLVRKLVLSIILAGLLVMLLPAVARAADVNVVLGMDTEATASPGDHVYLSAFYFDLVAPGLVESGPRAYRVDICVTDPSGDAECWSTTAADWGPVVPYAEEPIPGFEDWTPDDAADDFPSANMPRRAFISWLRCDLGALTAGEYRVAATGTLLRPHIQWDGFGPGAPPAIVRPPMDSDTKNITIHVVDSID
jgi:hypothetical protein